MVPRYLKGFICFNVYRCGIFSITLTETIHNYCDFVSDLNVISCFEVKPRKRRSDSGDDPVCRKAFRLCINRNDRDQLLEANKLPANFVIYDYFSHQRIKLVLKRLLVLFTMVILAIQYYR